VQHVCGAALLKFAAGAACVKAGRAVAPAAGSALKVQRETRKIDTCWRRRAILCNMANKSC
jgi:hypothetical protein